MYRRDLDGLINAGRLPNFILLHGGEEFLNELYAKEIISIWNAQNCEHIYYDEYNFDQFRDFLEPSLFSASNTLHIKMSKQIPAKEVKHFIAACQRDANNHFLFEFFEDTNRASGEFLKAFGANDVRFFKPNTPNEAILLLNKKCISTGISPNQAALTQIYQIHNGNLNLCASEIEKFAMLNLPLNVENVRNAVFGLSEISFEDLFEKILNLRDFRDDFFTYIQSGSYNELALINYIYSAIFRLFKIHSYIRINGNFNLIAAIGYNPPANVANSLKNAALKLNLETFREIFMLLNRTEFRLKTRANLDKTTFLLSALLELQSIISKANKSKI